MPKTEVILTHNIVGLGGESDQVSVAAGYARNYLFPNGYAIPVTGANKKRIESLQKRRAEREAHELNTMTDLAKSVGKLVCVVTAKTGEDGKLFGTVTTGMIADQLKNQFEITLDKKKIHIERPIKTLGEYEVDLNLHADVKATLKVRVESNLQLSPEAIAAAAVDAAANAAADAAAPKTESRAKRAKSDKGDDEAKAEKPKKAKAEKK